jgi:hypothetical protein
MHTPPQLDSLPPELLELILLWTVRMCRCEKNNVLPLRCVSKAFNTALRPYVLKTIQLEFSRFLRTGPELPSTEALEAIGGFCQAVYLDMMVVRDEGMLYHSIGGTNWRFLGLEFLRYWLTMNRGNNSTR